MKRVAVYYRVSKGDQKTLPMQKEALLQYVAHRGWNLVQDVADIGSGAKERPKRNAILDAARRREIDVVVCWRLDRWGRSLPDLISTIQELQELGVGFVSVTEALDLTTSVGRAMAAMLATFAQFERDILKERVRAGLAHAKQQGKKLGRPITVLQHEKKILALRAKGLSKSAIAVKVGFDRRSVGRVIAAHVARENKIEI